MAYNNINQSSVTTTYTQGLSAFDLPVENYAVQVAATVSTPSAGLFTADETTDTLTKASHGMSTGLVVQVSSTTTLPAGLSAATNYYVIALTANTFKLASSLGNAQAGTAIDITDAGTGDHTITPTALAGASVKLQESVDGQNWYDISGTSTNITATSNTLLTGTSKCGQIRPYITMSSGQLDIVIKANLK